MSMLAHDYIPSLRFGAKVLNSEILGGGLLDDFHNVWYVDGDNGSDSNVGNTPTSAVASIGQAVSNASAGDTILVKARKTVPGATDPTNYAETVIIPMSKPELKIIGVGTGRVQNGLPQMKIGAGSTAMITVRAPGCLIANMGINGISSTGGGILLDDDGGTTGVACGTTIMNCHFKNCVGSTATNAATGGAIMWSADGGAWQVLIKGCRFYKNVGDIVLMGTSVSVPQDVVIEDNIFSGPAASVDCNLFLKGGGSGINGVVIRNNVFTADPAIGSASNGNFLELTGCVGILAGNMFACITEEADTEITFGAAGVNKVPTTVFMAANYGEWGTAGAPGVGSGEIFRT